MFEFLNEGSVLIMSPFERLDIHVDWKSFDHWTNVMLEKVPEEIAEES